MGTSLAVLGKKIYAVGGTQSVSNTTSTDLVESYDETTGTWTTAAFRLSQPKRNFDALVVPASLFSQLPGGCQGVI
jgi:hypothetical protein